MNRPFRFFLYAVALGLASACGTSSSTPDGGAPGTNTSSSSSSSGGTGNSSSGAGSGNGSSSSSGGGGNDSGGTSSGSSSSSSGGMPPGDDGGSDSGSSSGSSSSGGPVGDGGTTFSDPTMVKVPTAGTMKCPVAPGGDINAAIAMCSMDGGGTVTLSAGTYSTPSIHAMNNVTVSLNGATITSSGVDAAETDSMIAPYANCEDDGHRHWHNAVIWGENVTNAAFIGPGNINGPGLDTNASKLIAFKNSDTILFDNLTMTGGTGHFAFLMTNVKNLTLSKLTIHPSRDGVDLMECSNVYAHDLNVTGGGDDAFALKSDCTVGMAVTTDNVTVTNSTFGSGATAAQFGSETWGNFQNISYSNITVIAGGKSGLGIQMNDGGIIKNLSYDHITLSGTSIPIFMNVTSLLRAGTKTPGHAENVHFSNITAMSIPGGQTPAADSVIVINGEPNDPHIGIFFDNINMTFAGGGSGNPTPPEGSSATFTSNPMASYNPRFFGPVPSYAAYVRHAKDVEFHNVKFGFKATDARPAVVADDVNGLVFDTFTPQKGSGSLLTLMNVMSLSITNSAPLPNAMVPSVTMMSY
jgi:hypothetical protein